jgi:Holliday junction resolvase
MPNPNYRAGRRLEWLWMAQKKQQGYTVMRSAGSHGLVDCIAWNDSEMVLVQVKNGNRAWNSRDLENLRAMPRPAGAKVYLVVRDGGLKEWEYIEC